MQTSSDNSEALNEDLKTTQTPKQIQFSFVARTCRFLTLSFRLGMSLSTYVTMCICTHTEIYMCIYIYISPSTIREIFCEECANVDPTSEELPFAYWFLVLREYGISLYSAYSYTSRFHIGIIFPGSLLRTSKLCVYTHSHEQFLLLFWQESRFFSQPTLNPKA